MAQILKPDKWQLGISGSQIVMPAGAILTIGGQQYTTTSSLSITPALSSTAQRRQIYAVLAAGAVALVDSVNENSIGPSGYSAWKLVGAYQVSDLGFVFYNIDGVPQTDWLKFTPTYQNFSIGDGFEEWYYKIDGDSVELQGNIRIGGTTSFTGEWRISIPGLSFDYNKLGDADAGGNQYAYVGVGQTFDSGATGLHMATVVTYNGTNFLRLEIKRDDGVWGIVTPTFPFSFASGDAIVISRAKIPLVGFGVTPIKER